MKITLNHDVDIHVRLHMSALCARRHDLPLLFDKVAICQIDCWRIQPNTELPETCNELISFPDSAPPPAPPPPPQHYTTVPYSTELWYRILSITWRWHNAGKDRLTHGPSHPTTQHSRSVSDSPSPFALSSRHQRPERARRHLSHAPCDAGSRAPPAVHRGIDTFLIRLLNSLAPLRSLFLITLFLAPNNVETTLCSLRSKGKV